MTKQTRPTAIFRTKPIVILAASHFVDRYFRPVCCCDPEVMGLVVVVGFMPLILFVMLLGVSSIFLVVFANGMSALPPIVDMCAATRDVRFVPIADMSLNTELPY